MLMPLCLGNKNYICSVNGGNTLSLESNKMSNTDSKSSPQEFPLKRIVLTTILISLIVAIIALATYGVSSRCSEISEAKQAISKVKALDAYITKESDNFKKSLQSAVNTADASKPAESLGEHIKLTTKAEYVMIVAPYSESLEPESEAFSKAIVYDSGTDAALTTEFELWIQSAKGKAINGVSDFVELVFLSGQPIKIGRLNGYVLIAKPLALKRFDNMNVRQVESGYLYKEILPRGVTDLNTVENCSNLIYWAGYLRNASSLTVYVELADWEYDLAGRVILTAPQKSAADRKIAIALPYIIAIVVSLFIGAFVGIVLMRKLLYAK
jgi:hypothetical protein